MSRCYLKVFAGPQSVGRRSCGAGRMDADPFAPERTTLHPHTRSAGASRYQ